MRQWKELLASFSTRQRLTLLVAAAVVTAGLFAFVRWRRESDFRPLYTSLAADDAGAVVTRLKEGGTDYRLSEDGRTVLVPSATIAETRLSMAAAGLPKNGRIGFELFDRTNFGATEFTEHINYRRALEGELERSVMCLSEVEQARVHLTFAKDSVFVESRQPAKGSVMVKLRTGARLAPHNVVAICHLLASAVEDLAPEAVSVLDMRGNLLNRPRKALSLDGSEPPEAMLAFRQNVERDLLVKIHSTLEPLLGPEKFRASVMADCDFTTAEQSEETFDPSRSVMISSQKTEDVTGAGGAAGVPGTASNLPRPTSRPASTRAGVSRRTENISYQSSRVVRRTKLPMGSIKRTSVSVLVDHNVRWEGEGEQTRRVLEPPPPEKLQTIRDLVAAAIGFTAERGDQLVVESLPFESTLNPEPPGAVSPPSPAPPSGAPGWVQELLQNRKLQILVAVGAGVFLLLGFLAILLMRRRSRQTIDIAAPPELPAGTPTGTGEQQAAVPQRRPERRIETEAPSLPELPTTATKKTDLLAGQLRNAIEKDPVASAQVLRSWLTDEEIE
jgi:flagellar M-ring protein FliF